MHYAVSTSCPCPRTGGPLAAPDSRQAVSALYTRSALAAAFYGLAPGGQLKLLSLLFLGLLSAAAVDAVLEGAAFDPRLRSLRAAAAGAQAYGALVLVFRVHHEDRHVVADTQALFAGAPLVGVAAGALCWLRWRLDARVARHFLAEVEGGKAKDPAMSANTLMLSLEFDYASADQVHRVAAAMVAPRLPPSGKLPALRALALETVFLTGCRQFPESALLQALFAAFKRDLGTPEEGPWAQSGLSNVERARAMASSKRERYLVHAEDAHLKAAARASHGGGGGSGNAEAPMDLQAYVEFQNTLAGVVKTHRSTLAANRRFWRLLARDSFSFQAISAAFAEIDSLEAKADKAYRATLEKHPQNVKLLRAYSRFCEEVLGDPRKAAKLAALADKHDAAATADGEGREDEGDASGGGVNEKLDAIVVINASGVITIANRNLHRMFGYKKDELVGKNVSVLMGSPYNHQHSGYVKRYLKTQKATILDQRQRLEGRHKLGQLFQIALVVSRIESGGEVCFMGVIKAVKDDTAGATVTADGLIRTANAALTEMFGFAAADLSGKPFSQLAAPDQAAAVEAAIGAAVRGAESEHTFNGRHANGTVFPVSLEMAFDPVGKGAAIKASPFSPLPPYPARSARPCRPSRGRPTRPDAGDVAEHQPGNHHHR